MAGVCKSPCDSGKYKAWFMDWNGYQKFFMGTRNSKETLAMARKFEDDHRQVRLGYRQPPKLSDTNRLFKTVAKEYLDWGKAQGGLGGRPWGWKHAIKKEALLDYWQRELNIKSLSDLDNIMPRVEKVLRAIKESGRAGKTVLNYVEALTAFCSWCVKRGYLDKHPLKNLTTFDLTPKSVRRALTTKEIQKLLKHCKPRRRLLYEVAIMTGLRAGEIASLKVADLDIEKCGLYLHAEWTKNRREGFQPLPKDLAERLFEASKDKDLNSHLLHVTGHPARELEVDLDAAGIPKWTAEGKIDFHSLRVTFVTLIIEAGANIKEAQTLARHATPDLTINTYAKTNSNSLKNVAERAQKMAFFM